MLGMLSRMKFMRSLGGRDQWFCSLGHLGLHRRRHHPLHARLQIGSDDPIAIGVFVLIAYLVRSTKSRRQAELFEDRCWTTSTPTCTPSTAPSEGASWTK